MVQPTMFAQVALDASNTSPSGYAAAVTPTDTAGGAFMSLTRGLYIGTGGNVAVIMAHGETVTFTGATSGSVLPICCGQVNSTNTTATAIVALF